MIKFICDTVTVQRIGS